VTRRALVTVVIDGPLFALCWYLAFFLRTGDVHLGAQWGIFVPSLPLAVGTAILGFLAAGTYRPRRTGDVLDDFRRIARGSAYGFLGFVTATVFLQISGWWPRPLFALYALLLPFAGIVSLLLRLFFRALFTLKKKAGRERPVLIIGSGEDAGHLIREMKEDGARGLTPVGIVDEGNWPQGKEIHGVRVLGVCEGMIDFVERQEVDLIVLALPSAKSYQMRRLVSLCEKTGVPFRTLPPLDRLMSGQVMVNQLREVSIDDLLGREPVSLDWDAIRLELKDKSVLVTGAGGSIGPFETLIFEVELIEINS